MTRSNDARGSDARSSDARNNDTRGSDARGSDAKSSDARDKDARSNDTLHFTKRHRIMTHFTLYTTNPVEYYESEGPYEQALQSIVSIVKVTATVRPWPMDDFKPEYRDIALLIPSKK
jgi:hypothetical protein